MLWSDVNYYIYFISNHYAQKVLPT